MQEGDLAAEASWCRRYATVNATGLRKIAKKHDKYTRNSAGQQFLQVPLAAHPAARTVRSTHSSPNDAAE